MALPVRPKPAALIVLDGWGIAPLSDGNAITRAKTPNLTGYATTYPTFPISASGIEVGLLWGEMGNSEVGHLNIGAGRVYYQTLPRINTAMESGAFAANDAFQKAFLHARANGGAVHLIGLLTRGNVHASFEHVDALLTLCQQQKVKNVFLHLILDGRDTVYNAGKDFVAQLQERMEVLGVGAIATLSGRQCAMDRDNRWDRTEKAFRAMVEGVADETTDDPLACINAQYALKHYDEEFPPTVVTNKGKPVATISQKDAVIVWNFRPDRARQLTEALALPAFAKCPRPEGYVPPFVVTMTEYEKDLPVTVAFPPDIIKTCLAKVLSDAGLTQLHIAETEKYAHVTFFLNGTTEEAFPGEERALVPSPRVSSYDQKPEMGAQEIADRVVKEIEGENFDFYAINFANADMVAHTGNMKASITACETIDRCVGAIVQSALAKGGVVFITADHGNAEELTNLQTGEMDKEHSTSPVPFFIISNAYEGKVNETLVALGGDLSLVPPVGMLADVAPTILSVLGIEKPGDMTGNALL